MTGGIGSGKSYVAQMFATLEIPIYYADKEAKRLMIQDKGLKSDIKVLLGEDAYYRNGRLNKPFVANKIFKDKKLLTGINNLVHPAVKRDFESWADLQDSKYVIEESAILFENGLNKYFDTIVLVTADKDLRINRVIKRDKVAKEQVLARMNQQLPDENKLPLAKFVVVNNEKGDLHLQITTIHKEILSLIKN